MNTLVRMKTRANTRVQHTLRPTPNQTSPVWIATQPLPNNVSWPPILLKRSLDLHQPDLTIWEISFKPGNKIAAATNNPSARSTTDAELKAAL